MKIGKRSVYFAIASLVLAATFSLLNSPAWAGLEEAASAYEAGNVPLAAQEFRACAEKGEVDCQFNLALMREKGIGVPQDGKETVVWYRKSAEQGNSSAQYNLGVLDENGRRCAVDFAQANQWYRKVSVQGDALAVGNLGMLYLRLWPEKRQGGSQVTSHPAAGRLDRLHVHWGPGCSAPRHYWCAATKSNQPR